MNQRFSIPERSLRMRDGHFWRHSSLVSETREKRKIIHPTTGIFSPLFHGLCFSPCGDENRISSVARLLKGCSPAAIIWLVMAVYISTIKAESGSWPVAGGQGPFQEGFEVVAPFIADRDAAPTIVEKVFAFRVVAPVDHASPNLDQKVTVGPQYALRFGFAATGTRAVFSNDAPTPVVFADWFPAPSAWNDDQLHPDQYRSISGNGVVLERTTPSIINKFQRRKRQWQ